MSPEEKRAKERALDSGTEATPKIDYSLWLALTGSQFMETQLVNFKFQLIKFCLLVTLGGGGLAAK